MPSSSPIPRRHTDIMKMLKNSRIPLFKREKEQPRQIGNPTLMETTFDTNRFRDMAHVGQARRDELKRVADAGHVSNFAARGRGPPAPSKYPPHHPNHSLTPPPNPPHRNDRISAAPTWDTHSVYSQAVSNNGYDYMEHPTYYTTDNVANPSPPISPILEPASRNDQYGSRSRSISPIGHSPPSHSHYSPVTAAIPHQRTHKRVPSGAESVISTATTKTTATSRKPVPVRSPPPEAKRHIIPDGPRPRERDLAALTLSRQRASLPTSTGLSSPTAASTRTVSTSKALPPPPSAVRPDDLVGNLQSQMEDFHIQKCNINKVMLDLKKPQPQNPLVSDLAMRREIERRLKELEEELHMLTSEEHEVGVRLHRALRKREREMCLEPTTLWVRRVTS